MLVVLLFSFFVLCEAVHWFLAVAEMNDHKLGLKKKKVILIFWRPESEIKVLAQRLPPEALGKIPFLTFSSW